MYRVDKNEPVEITMKPTSKTHVYFNDPKAQFIQDLMGGSSTVLIRIYDYSYDTATARFTLNGSTAAIQEVLNTCG